MRPATFLPILAASALAACTGTRVQPPIGGESGATELTGASTGSDGPERTPPMMTTPIPPRNPAAATTGTVEFRGFTDEALADFRLIPEEGSMLFTPTNGTYPDVDGFWWRHSRQWFKIPNHCAVIVTAAPEPDRPSAFTEIHDCGALGSALQKLRGLPDTAGFYPDGGVTGHGTDYPFQP